MKSILFESGEFFKHFSVMRNASVINRVIIRRHNAGSPQKYSTIQTELSFIFALKEKICCAHSLPSR
ncbi:MAG: hypothetical protein Q4G28_09495 [Neisseria sp.]|nr:hypothetical protein [Neisseria sp.]